MSQQDLHFSDAQLQYLTKNFRSLHWDVLSLLYFDYPSREERQPLPFHDTKELVMNDVYKKLDVSINALRPHITLLAGATAIEIDSGNTDQRSKILRLTPEGYRMMQLYYA